MQWRVQTGGSPTETKAKRARNKDIGHVDLLRVYIHFIVGIVLR